MVKTVDEAVSKYYPECLDVFNMRNKYVVDILFGLMRVRGATIEELRAVNDDWIKNWQTT